MSLACRTFLKSCVLSASIFMTANFVCSAHADWQNTANVYQCTSGSCALSCTAANECEGYTFIASQGATNASITCFGESACLNTVFYLAASNENKITCLGTDSCKNSDINVGVPNSGVIVDPVPNSFFQRDFFGLINKFQLNCSGDSSCVSTDIISYYQITAQTIFCTAETDACKDLIVNAFSTVGDVSISCEETNSCNNVAFTTAAVTSACVGDYCSSVTHTENAVPTPDVDGDGVLDVNDLCPTGMSVITDVAPSDGCDDVEEKPDFDNDGVPDVVDGQTLEWDGPIFFGDFFNEDNWKDKGLATAADVINPSKVIGREIVMANVALNLPDNTDIFLGQGNSLTITGTTLGAGINTNFYPLPTIGGNALIKVKGTSTFNFGLAWDITLTLEGSSRVVSANTDFNSDTGVLGKNTTINFVGGKTRAIFSTINTHDVKTMLAKFFINGDAAVLDNNIIIKQNDASGSIVLPDFDGDGFGGNEDNCPNSVSVTTDFDGDGCDDIAEDNDDDGDGVADDFDACVTADFSLSADFDFDGCDDNDEDLDDDNDGKLDTLDACVTVDGNLSADVDDDGCDDADEDKDIDNDGVLNEFDQCFTQDFNLSADNDKDGCDDADEDKDDDNDGVLDKDDAFPNDSSRTIKGKSGGGGGSLFYLLGLSAWVLRKRLYHDHFRI